MGCNSPRKCTTGKANRPWLLQFFFESVHLNEGKRQLQKAFVSHHVFLNFLSFLRSAPLSMVIQSLTDLPQKNGPKDLEVSKCEMISEGLWPRTHGVFILQQVAVFSKTFEVQPYLGEDSHTFDKG